MGSITIFADYIVFAVLRELGVLQNSLALAGTIDSNDEIYSGREEEVEKMKDFIKAKFRKQESSVEFLVRMREYTKKKKRTFWSPLRHGRGEDYFSLTYQREQLQEDSENILTEYIVGLILRRRPITKICFELYGYTSMTQAIFFLFDFKLGHYTKTLARSMLLVQFIGTIIVGTIILVVAWWLLNFINHICHDNLSPFNNRYWFNGKRHLNQMLLGNIIDCLNTGFLNANLVDKIPFISEMGLGSDLCVWLFFAWLAVGASTVMGSSVMSHGPWGVNVFQRFNVNDHRTLVERVVARPRTFNVLEHGAVADGSKDSTQAFTRAWKNACAWQGKTTRILIPKAKVSSISSINSKFFHMNIYKSKNIKMESLKIFAPENSPNTDGIHIGDSSNVDISHSRIGTGDDCISVGPGSYNVTITNIDCGPGHGISYCPLDYCSQKSASRIKIKNISFKNIRGTSASKVAVKFLCSSKVPCQEVKLSNINIKYNGPGGHALSNCSYVNGLSSGLQVPSSCL
ncbi:hypothetical protein MRB53_010419 [Persea americana]|uniref:Uncharacterized protein n=1 Tax=Persea americana TaxID=3435 RepID=A0ACC2LSS7_PERAE|nr:hypothetical protein MRB53_010419 [Persea americana]